MSARRIDPPRDLARVAQVADAARRAFVAGRPGDAARLADEAAHTLARATSDVRAWVNGMSLGEVADLHAIPVDDVRHALSDGALDVVVWRSHGRVEEASAVALHPRRPLPADVDERAATLAAYVAHVGRARVTDICDAFGRSSRALRPALVGALATGLLARDARGVYSTPTPEAAA